MIALRIPPPVWMVLAAVAMWCLDRYLPLMPIVAAPWRPVGWAVMAAALVPVLAAVALFVTARTTVNPHDPTRATTLVTSGIYRWTRNPMYLGLSIVLAGWAVRLGTLSPFVVPPLFALILVRVQIIPEECALRARFGDDYERYCGSVGRWFGRSRGERRKVA